jgi:hypothetical protein
MASGFRRTSHPASTIVGIVRSTVRALVEASAAIVSTDGHASPSAFAYSAIAQAIAFAVVESPLSRMMARLH